LRSSEIRYRLLCYNPLSAVYLRMCFITEPKREMMATLQATSGDRKAK